MLWVHGFGTNVTSWFSVITEVSRFTIARVQTAQWALRGIMATMLIGHGGFALVMGKPSLIRFYEAAGLGVVGVPLPTVSAVLGSFEMLLGVLCLEVNRVQADAHQELLPLAPAGKEASMDFGIFSMFTTREGRTQAQVFKEWFDLVQVAEDMGIDTFWLGESHFRPNRAVLASPLIGASAVAARTTRIRVGLAVQVLPLANPLRVAEEAAIVDHISEGRLIFGVGRSSFLESYQGYNVDYEESRARFFESLEVIQRAWGDAPLSYEGQYYKFRDVDVVPKPYQRPHPPIRVAVESRDTFPLIGRLGFPIFIRYQMDIPELQELLKQYWEERHTAGFSGPNDVILQIAAYVAETAEQAYTEPEASTMRQRRLVREALGRTGDQEAFERLRRLAEVSYDEVLHRVAYGTPEAVVERLQEYQEELGITGVSLDMNPGGQIPYDRVVNSMRLLAEQVIPQFK